MKFNYTIGLCNDILLQNIFFIFKLSYLLDLPEPSIPIKMTLFPLVLPKNVLSINAVRITSRTATNTGIISNVMELKNNFQYCSRN